MRIILNGNIYQTQDRITLHELVTELKCNNKNIAVAVNQSIIPQGNYLGLWLYDNDKVEILTAFQGG
jgi:sulfur carrier protein